MIFYIWDCIVDAIDTFLFFFRKFFCKYYFVNASGVGACGINRVISVIHNGCYSCEKCYCPKRKANKEKGGEE